MLLVCLYAVLEKLKHLVNETIDHFLEQVPTGWCQPCHSMEARLRKKMSDAPHGCTAEELLELYLSMTISAKDKEISRLLAEVDGLRQELETKARTSATATANATAKAGTNELHNSTEVPPQCPGPEMSSTVSDLRQETQAKVLSYDDDDHSADSTDQHTVDPSKIPARTPPVKRAAGHSNDCPCCSKFYQAVYTGSPEIEGRVHMASRHKTRDKMPGTPPGFWSINFTQE